TGEHLFRDENDAATVHNVIAKEVPLPSSRGENPPPAAFDAVILRALERDVTKRFDTTLDMAEALRRAAAEASVFGTRQSVARWVTSTFGEELESRRTAIREATRRNTSPEFRDYSQVTVLPALPSSLTNTTVDGTPSSLRIGGAEETLPTEAIVTVPPPGMEDNQQTSPFVDRHARQKRLALGVGVAVVLFVLAGLLIRSSTAKQPEEPVRDKPVAAAATPPNIPAAVATSEPAPAATSAAHEESKPASDRTSDIDKKAKGARRVSVRPAAVAQPRPENPSATEPPTPRPTAAPQADFEKNPYLHH
ncbi:MAG TPA: hypothetical protein VHU80_02530, partial [Polyangiaceae bacterium]|nr:hypothetical protein [Polyangiaceae bacterium]